MSIKGPDFRNKLEVRRRWKCPDCQRELLLPGDRTSVRCNCKGEEKLMQLVGEFIPQTAQRLNFPSDDDEQVETP
ncbi:MAG: hypothetical protein R3C11_02655 [Planctomycetaceae bacterium]